jgi:alkylhydroperoxidase/carboxymuconolactone decarboxylase family protein YurZ
MEEHEQVNVPLRGHLNGAINNGATREEVEAVRAIAIRICEVAGMKLLRAGENGLGWREEIAKL